MDVRQSETRPGTPGDSAKFSMSRGIPVEKNWPLVLGLNEDGTAQISNKFNGPLTF